MKTFLKLAWRNLFRNKRRTFIAGSAIGIGLASLIFTDALLIGMDENMIDSATNSFLGEAEIHQKDYRQSYEVEDVIVNPEKVLSELAEDTLVRYFTPRVQAFGMLTSPANVNAVTMVGIDPKTEANLSQVNNAIEKGNYFSGDNPRDIVIGRDLADQLEVEIGDRVVMTVAQAHSGDLAQEMFRVSGIFFFNIKEMDKGMAFVRKAKAQSMLNIGDNIHEIAINFQKRSYSQDANLAFWSKYSQDGNECVSWTTLLPQMKAVLELTNFNKYIVGIILFLVVTLGIINTLFMSLHERMFEFGVMRAVGTSPFAMGRLVVFEAGALAVISIIMGVILGLVITYYFSHVGIDYRGIEFAGVTFRKLLYPVLTLDQFIRYPIWILIFTMVVGLYPAFYAARMKPVDAMRRSF